MSAFRASEKKRQAALKADRTLFSQGANRDGTVRSRRGSRQYSHVLPEGHETENILAPYRADALSMYRALGIRWHQGGPARPTANMCSSQVCATNFLIPFARDPELAATLFRGVFPDLGEVLPFENANGPLYVTFEWIGKDNYLREKVGRTGKRTRGRNFTSADAAFRFSVGGRTHTVLIEWKYTESYPYRDITIAKSGTDRSEIYRHVVDGESSPVSAEIYGELFHEPFYQIFRQQALAAAMQRNREDNADTVSVLHISPLANAELHRVTSKSLMSRGGDVFNLWGEVVQSPHQFRSVSTRDVFGAICSDPPAKLREWASYVTRRYAPLLEA